MKVLLVGLNSKYVHSSLAIRYLKAYSQDILDVDIEEYTINQTIDHIVSEIYKKDVDLVGFSTYIWNVLQTYEVAETLKIIRPDLKILVGGPEVSYDGLEVLRKNPFIDFVIYGEGEETFREFLIRTLAKESYKGLEGLIYREGEELIKNPPRPLMADLNKIPSPYDENVGRELKNKIVYFESSRGCPFGCKFCLSSTIRGVRYFDIERVKRELGLLIDAKVRQVKFVDRTFNANKAYSMEVINYIMDRDPEDINFHFEVTAHLIDDEMLDLLSRAKEGLFQLEVGVQSTNPKTIKAIGRTTDFEKLRQVTKRIESFKNTHQHLDLIAGLPYEDYGSFRRSFDQVYEIRPEKIQLGFLKLLKGSELRERQEYGFKYLDRPPYEVLATNYIGYEDIRKLKFIEEMVETYYNEELFKHSVEFIIANYYTSAFDFYEDLASYWEDRGYHQMAHGRRKLYEILLGFYEDRGLGQLDIFKELVKYDFVGNNKGLKLPRGLNRLKLSIGRTHYHDLLKDQDLLDEYFTDYRDSFTKDLIKDIEIERYNRDIFKIIGGAYILKEGLDYEKDLHVLTHYREGVIEFSRSYDISSYVEEMMS